MDNSRLSGGLSLILCGIALIIYKLGYFSDTNIFTILFTIFLVGIIIKSVLKANFAGILFPIALICIDYDEQLGITAITPWTVLIAALLGSVGLSMVFNKYINTDKFEQADLKCSFGAMKVYFDNAVLYEGKGYVNIEAFFSGVELYIPRNWTVENISTTSFSAITEKNRNEGTADNILTICGCIDFSGVEIIYI